MYEKRNRIAMTSRAQELLDLAVGKVGKCEYKETNHFTQEVTSISSKTDKTFVDKNGELKEGYYNLRFNYTDKWKSIFMISLVYIETFFLDKFEGERATHNYIKIQNLDKIVNILKQDGYQIDEDRVFKKRNNE